MSNGLRFKPFDEQGEVRLYYNGFLPHWRQSGCTYFVTFRLADSVPQPVVDEWKHERNRWLAARGIDVNTPCWYQAVTALSEEDRRTFERHFASRLFQYLDRGRGDCVLRDSEVSTLVADALMFFHRERLDTGDFVVMPNHVHGLLTPYPGFELEHVLHSIKSYTANQINRKIKRSGTLWMEESHDHIVRDSEELLRIQAYIRANPGKAKLSDGEYRLQEAEYDLTE
jgi:type I restriction enzyme R subunit